MSMTVHYKHISPWLLSQFKKHPNLVEPFMLLLPNAFEPGIPVELIEKIQDMAESADEFTRELQKDIKVISPDNAEKILSEASTKGFTLGKMFKEVQFHLSGEIADHGTNLFSQAVTGGDDIGSDTGYGPPTYLTKDNVKKISELLSGVTDNDFITKYSTDKWDKEVTHAALVYFKELAAYYKTAAQAGHAMLVWGA